MSERLNGRQVLDRLLQREPGLSELVQRLVDERVPEDLWLEYKRGAELEKPKKRRADDLRRWVSGFANGDGGVLLIGIAGGENEDDSESDAWSITGCESSHVGRDLCEWASRVLGELGPHLNSPPLILEIPTQRGRVLAIAVERSGKLVPVNDAGSIRHYLRIGDQTLAVDPYLYADLVLGRRQDPELDLRVSLWPNSSSIQTGIVRLRFDYENPGLVWVPQLRALVVGYFVSDPSKRARGEPQPIPVAKSLLPHLEVRPMGPNLGTQVSLGMAVSDPAMRDEPVLGLPALQSDTRLYELPLPEDPGHATWLAAACLLPSNGLPHWFQLSLTTQGDWSNADLECERVRTSERPRVAYGGIDEILDE